MDRTSLRTAAIRYGLLFVISVILVMGFWFHAEFYQIGFGPLVLIGGVVTFLVIMSVRTLGRGVLWHGPTRGSLTFSREAAERVLAGTQTITILPVDTNVPPAGSLTRAVVAATQQSVAEVRVRDVRRRLAADVREAEAAAAGFDGVDAFRTAWARGGRWNPSDLVLLVDFRREARG